MRTNMTRIRQWNVGTGRELKNNDYFRIEVAVLIRTRRLKVIGMGCRFRHYGLRLPSWSLAPERSG
jgi:hypothetical protein